MEENKQVSYSSAPSPNDYQLKWHKFLIYFALWAGALLNAATGVRYITGNIYGANVSAVYNRFPGLKTVDVVMGLLCIALAAYMLVVRFQLAGYKTGAPNKLVSLYLINAGINLVYLFAASASTGLSLSDLIDATFWTSVIGSAAYALINKNYYDKRAALFVN